MSRGSRAAPVIVVLTALFLPVLGKPQGQLSAYSDHWNDISQFRKMVGQKGLELRCLLTGPKALKLENADTSTLVILGVEKPYSSEELGIISRFVQFGGNLLIADDFGYGNAVLAQITDDTVSFEKKHLRDIYYDKNPSFVRVWSRSLNIFGNSTRELLLNKPAALSLHDAAFRPPNQSATVVLASASPNAWLDENNNLVRDIGEKAYAYPVAALYGSSLSPRSITCVISDPGIFVNDMLNRSGNRVFVSELVDYMARGNRTVIIDDSRHAPDSSESITGMALLSAATGFSGNQAAIMFAFVAMFMLFAYQYFRIPPDIIRRHRDTLAEPKLMHFTSGYVETAEFQRLRFAILEKVRLAYGYSSEEFYPAIFPHVPQLLGNPELQQFLSSDPAQYVAMRSAGAAYYGYMPDQMVFSRLLALTHAWTPPPGVLPTYEYSRTPGKEVRTVEDLSQMPAYRPTQYQQPAASAEYPTGLHAGAAEDVAAEAYDALPIEDMVPISPVEVVEDGKGPGPIELLDGGPAWHRAPDDQPASYPDEAEGDPSRAGASKPTDGPDWSTGEVDIDALLERTENAAVPKTEDAGKCIERIPPAKKGEPRKEGAG